MLYVIRIANAAERRVLLLEHAPVRLFGPRGSMAYLHTFDAASGTTPAAAAWNGGEVARRADEALRGRVQQAATGEERQTAAVGRLAPGGGRPSGDRASGNSDLRRDNASCTLWGCCRGAGP
jgi:hypothetical protein